MALSSRSSGVPTSPDVVTVSRETGPFADVHGASVGSVVDAGVDAPPRPVSRETDGSVGRGPVSATACGESVLESTGRVASGPEELVVDV